MKIDLAKLSTAETSPAVGHILANTYKLLACQLGLTAVVALVAQTLGLNFMPPLLFLVAFYAFVWAINRTRNSVIGLYLSFGLAIMMGLGLGPMIDFVASSENGASLIGTAFLMTALTFGSLSAYALQTKKDLSFLSGFLVAGFIVLMGGVVVSLFTDISGLSLALSCGFALFSCAAILLQTNLLVRGGETNYILAALSLYVSIYNLFSSLVHLLLSVKD